MQPSWHALNTRWWSPLQWLSIVATIWLDQERYWHSLRPVLQRNRSGLSVLVQGIAGTLLLALPMTTLVSMLASRLTGAQETPYLGTLLLIAIGVVLAITIIVSYLQGMAMGLVFGTVFGLTLQVLIGVLPVHPLPTVGGGLVIFWVIGFGVGLSNAIKQGEASREMAIGESVLIGLAITLAQQSLTQGILIGSFYGLGYSFGGRWATRQISDPLVRRQLARSEAASDQRPGSQADET